MLDTKRIINEMSAKQAEQMSEFVEAFNHLERRVIAIEKQMLPNSAPVEEPAAPLINKGEEDAAGENESHAQQRTSEGPDSQTAGN